ncbi:MAG: hypothetical protein HZB62_10770 [Nitrospirae bacterium]|nr:hypothetical protein [Nitrospirota bacterium]
MTVTGTPAAGGSLLERTIAIVADSSAKLVNPDDYQAKLTAALKTYTGHRPDTAVVDITGDAGHDYALPAGWVEGVSRILSIEYPVDSVPAALLDNDEYQIYQATAAKKIRLLNNAPAATETVRVTFTTPRTEATVLVSDEDAVCDLAAAACLEQLANLFVQTSDPTIQADVVNYRSKSQEAASRAKTLRGLYKAHMNLKDDDTVQPASAVASLEQHYPGGADRLTHSRWSRRRR